MMKPSTKLRLFQLFVITMGLTVFILVDWRIAVGVFLFMYAENLGELVRQIQLREKYKEMTQKGE